MFSPYPIIPTNGVLVSAATVRTLLALATQDKVPTNLYKYALDGARTHETDLYQARGQPDTPQIKKHEE